MMQTILALIVLAAAAGPAAAQSALQKCKSIDDSLELLLSEHRMDVRR